MTRISKMLNKEQMAEKLGVSKRTLDRYRENGLPDIILPSGSIRFIEEDVMTWLTNNRKEK